MKRLTEKNIYDLITDRVAEAGSQKAFASQANISQQYLNDLLKHRRTPGPKILNSLGFTEVRLYERKEKK